MQFSRRHSECAIPSRLSLSFSRSLEANNSSPIGHMRITPPNGGIVAGNFVPGNVSFQPIYAHSFSQQADHCDDPTHGFGVLTEVLP
jgi:hypothetical protein